MNDMEKDQPMNRVRPIPSTDKSADGDLPLTQIRSAAVASLVAALAFSAIASSTVLASDIAVKRGQATVDPKILPLACLTIATNGVALPLYEIVIADIETGTEITLVVGDPDHPAEKLDMLTAVAKGNQSLSLAIVHLQPGTYLLKRLYFLYYRHQSESNFTFDVSGKNRYYCRIEPGCVSYLGTVAVSADWDKPTYSAIDLRYHNAAQTRIDYTITTEETSRRDFRWASDVVPGMKGLPSIPSPIKEITPGPESVQSTGQAEPGVKVPPVAIAQMKPAYPPSLQKARIAGNVVVEFVVGPDGSVVKAVAVSSPHPDLSTAAVDAVLRWKFHPGTKDGWPMYFQMRVEIFFSVK
jgi:TonB family protein